MSLSRVPRCLAAAGLLALAVAFPARAHGGLVRSIPEAGAVLAVSPPEILLDFSEALDPAATKVELLDVNGQVQVPGPGVIDPDEPKTLRLAIPPLPDGVYSAVWRARSAVDGHVTSGSVGFSIGAASPPASLLPPPGTPDPATAVPAIPETLIRWLAYLSAVLAVGSLTFGFLIWRPVFRQADPGEAVEAALRRRIRTLAGLGLAGLAGASLLFVMFQAAQARELPIWGALRIPPADLFSGRVGLIMGLRLLLILALGAFVLRLPSPARSPAWMSWLILLLCGALILTFSLQGHGAAQGSLPGVIMIWLHLAATIVWLGGLPILFLALRQPDVPASQLVPRFSTAALVSVAALAGTGLYNGITYAGSVEALLATTYGRSLIVKTALFALLLTLGAVNLLYLSPRLQQTNSRARTGLGRTVPLEMAIGAALLLAVGLLSAVFPAFEALQASRAEGIIETARVDDVDILLRVAPGQAGDNEFGVEFSDPRPGAADVEPQVLLRLASAEMDMGIEQVETQTTDGRRYTARGSYFPMAGPWEVEVILRRPGFNDVRQTFALEIPG